MNPFHPSFLVLAGSCLALGLILRLGRRAARTRRRGFVEIAARYRSFFREQGLTEPEHFLALPGETPYIVSGHPDRHVARVEMMTDSGRWVAFLKREHRVPWRVRLVNALAGFGLVSRSLREARTLQALAREGINGPEWLAAGEDGHGRAFLLVREVADAVELRGCLLSESDAVRRRRIAHHLGATLARLHAAGFRHPDLYANHVLIRSADGTVHVLDWQRCRWGRMLTWAERCRDLAALHATLADNLATPRERLACLRAYLRAEPRAAWRRVARSIEVEARHLLARRHIREKRQPPALVQPQAWICLDGEALCVTPALANRCGRRLPDWLEPQQEPRPGPLTLTRHWLALPGEARLLLWQRRRHQPLSAWWRWLRREPFVSPEQRQAALLFRLQRHAVAAPQVLALGQRHNGEGRVESFLLTEPPADTCSLEVWLRRRPKTRPARARRWSVLRQAGSLLARLHAASCYLDIGADGCGLAVQVTPEGPTIVLRSAENVRSRRRHRPRRARADVRRLQRLLRAAGCSRTDLRRFLAGYCQRPVSEGIPARKVLTSPKRQRGGAVATSGPLVGGAEPTSGPLVATGCRIFRGVRRLRQRPDWVLFAGADWADRIMDVAVTDRFHAKQGRSTGRWILQAPAADATDRRLSVYLKRHYQLPWWQRVLAALWPGRGWSPAYREWRNLQWARQQGLPVPEAVAAAEYIGPWGRLRSMLAVEELAGMLPLNEAVPLAAVRQEPAAFRRWKRGLLAEMARLTRMLHDRHYFHKDLYLCHFYLAAGDTRGEPAGGWRGRVFLIDLHRLAYHPWTGPWWQSKDLAQLLYSSAIIGVDVRDRLAFWRAYRGGGRWLRRLILFKWRRYRLHNARNRERMQEEG